MRRSQFSPNVKDLGEIKVGKTNLIIFNSSEDTSNIESVSSSCGCTEPVVKPNSIEVKFTPKRIPPHLEIIEMYTATQTVNIRYKNGDTELLIIKAKVVK